ncbi:hypothetical protein B1R94_02115 [Mycolicibacterium litorale]|nr:hypothetical protein B1R94_02115 [Mycolicibacterium litorale]
MVFVALALFCASWWVLFLSFWAWLVLLVASMVGVVVAGYLDQDRSDCGYRDTPFGHGPHPSAAPVVELSERRAVWPNDAGSPE